jgi:hypothetical protein
MLDHVYRHVSVASATISRVSYKNANHVHKMHIIAHKNTTAHIFINTTLLTLCHTDMFRPSKGHLQGVQEEHFNNKVNKLFTRCKIQRSVQRVTHYATAT